jgi:hypothetical protein
MFLQKILAKIHPKKKKIWKWALAIFVTVSIIGMIFIRLALGELGELGIFKISGFPTAKNYLIIFQNDAERRPTGGFITSFATLRFRAGIPFFEFGNVYDEKLIQKGSTPPSEVMVDLLAGDFYPGHGFRDGNFDADFPTTAKELIRLYELGFPDADFDGVIAIDFTAFENLAKKLNPSLIGAAGLFSQIENEVQNIDLHNPEEINSRKNFLANLAKNLIKKSILHPKTASASLLESLKAKHLLFYFRDPEIQKTAVAKNWGGVLSQNFAGDFLAVNEGNYGGMKSSRYLVRDIFYDVEFIENQSGELTPSANLKISLEHRGDAAEPISGYYKGFWRIFTPIGATKNFGKFEKEFDDGFHQVFGKIIKMNPREKREIALNYDLPAFVMQDGVYKLKLVKQPGSGSDFIRVTVKLPAGYLFHEAWSMEHETSLDIKENLAVYQTLLTEDKELELKILPDETLPRLAWQEFIGKNLRTIDLRFNEALDYESVAAAKFSLADMNYRNKRFDSVAIQRVRFIPPQNIRLDVSGVTPECREWYELRFSGISDKQGNTIEDGKITVVQWIDEFGNNCDPNREL